MKELKDLDVEWSMAKTIEILNKALEKIELEPSGKGAKIKGKGDFDELFALIQTKIAEAEEYYWRPVDDPKIYSRMQEISKALDNKELAEEYGKKIGEMEADKWEFEARLQNFYGNNIKALEFYNKALECLPDMEDAQKGKKSTEKKITKAEKDLPKLEDNVKKKPEDAALWIKMGIAQADLGNVDDALSSFEKAVGIAPDNPDAWVRKGFILALQGDFKSAMECCEKTLELNPNSMLAKRGRNYAEAHLD
ncbi:MAG: tetratricopeptide repeat protein [Thermoplasmata archaeon]|nr:MAG: tetratricopeptide repeat protein [Thermoplasmata archaeon]